MPFVLVVSANCNDFCLMCSLYDVRPSDNDLLDHLPLIRAAVKRDETLAKSKVFFFHLYNYTCHLFYMHQIIGGSGTILHPDGI